MGYNCLSIANEDTSHFVLQNNDKKKITVTKIDIYMYKDEPFVTSRLIRIYIVCYFVFDLRLKPYLHQWTSLNWRMEVSTLETREW